MTHFITRQRNMIVTLSVRLLFLVLTFRVGIGSQGLKTVITVDMVREKVGLGISLQDCSDLKPLQEMSTRHSLLNFEYSLVILN